MTFAVRSLTRMYPFPPSGTQTGPSVMPNRSLRSSSRASGAMTESSPGAARVMEKGWSRGGDSTVATTVEAAAAAAGAAAAVAAAAVAAAAVAAAADVAAAEVTADAATNATVIRRRRAVSP